VVGNLIPVQALFSVVLERALKELETLKGEAHLLWPHPVTIAHFTLKLSHGFGIEHIHVGEHREV